MSNELISKHSILKIPGVLTICFLVLAVTGCSRPSFQTGGAAIPTYRQPELLYLKADPYPRLEIEVVAVEGAEPSAQALAALQRFLETYCEKPDGIHMAPVKIIPADEAEGNVAVVLAVDHMAGPSADNSAYLYVFMYDSRIVDPGTKRSTLPSYVPFSYPCSIFIDVAHWEEDFQLFLPRILSHEAGHILGLTKNREHGDGSHCSDRDCLMYPTHSASTSRRSIRYRLHYDLCSDCQRDLNLARSGSGDPRYLFDGPALVRTEADYRVSLLPDIIHWDFEPYEPLDWQALRTQAVSHWRSEGKTFLGRYLAYRKEIAPNMVDRYGRALRISVNDPNAYVSALAERLARSLERLVNSRTVEPETSLLIRQ